MGRLDRAEAGRALADRLAALKRRSGLSYQELGRRVFAGSSSLHRYCSGRAVPPDYDVVVRLAKECGATADDVAALLRDWSIATGPDPKDETGPNDDDGAGTQPSSPAESPREVPVGAATSMPARDAESAAAPGVPRGTVPTGRLRRRRPLARRLAVLGLVLIVLATASDTASSGPGHPTAVKPIDAVGWTRTPEAVGPELFGVTMNSSSGAMPSFRVGALRLWDSETRWAQLEPRRGEFDWSALDRLLDGADRQGLDTLFVFGGTPAWAAPDARKAPYPDGSRAAAPDDPADWDDFVRSLVRHAGDRIDAYELWVAANHPHHYNGSVESLVEMTRRASAVIRAEDPGATLVCPSVTELWKTESHDFLLRFAAAGGYQYCDAAGVKLYQRRVTDPPETMLEAVRGVDRTFQRAGYHLPLWNTGTTQTLPLDDPLDEDTAADHAVRFYLTGLYARNRDLRRMYFYAWGNGKIPMVLQAEGQPPTKAGLFTARLQQWLAHARVDACGHGRGVGLPENVWQCEFLVPDELGASRRARIVWTHEGTADIPIGRRENRILFLDGTARDVDAHDTQRVSGRPILVESRSGGETDRRTHDVSGTR
ncbi:helix-turn-helix domain-containing protein [Embleya hyalina]|uniref:Peptidoglycan-binding protein n=1 Tax=Embleya hyalina TaxID=516124 RepID=A0A401YEE3_9ACTN|nr:helix-turn-helix transcriptional regulator [Embleya hyalina]GCD92974.1 peptidoglycan-binding protein [Embleya hyalina]